jgi:hypothetical protein
MEKTWKPRRAVEEARSFEWAGAINEGGECSSMRYRLMMQEPRDWIRPGFVLKPDTEESEWRRGWLLELGLGSVSIRSVGDAIDCRRNRIAPGER